MIFLKQSTASQEVLLGPFVDSTDGVTAETGLTIANTDIKLHVAGATTLANKNSGGATHISGGNYYAVLDATDTATLGSGAIVVQVSGALAVRHDFCVLPAMIYDSFIAGTDRLDTNVTHIGDTSQTARDIGASVLLSSGTGTGQVSLSSGLVSLSASQTCNITGNLSGSVGSVTAVSSGAITEASFATTAGSFARLGITDQGTAQSATSTTLVLRSAASFADDVLNGCMLMVFGSTQGYWQQRLITDYVGSTDTATVDAWAVTPSGTITYIVFASPSAPASSAADIRAAIGMASANLDTQLGTLATAANLALVKAKTDSLTFTTAGMVDSAIKRVGSTTLSLAGTGGQGYGG